VDRISLNLTVQGVGAAAAPKRDLNPSTSRVASQQLDAGAADEFRASMGAPPPNRYDEALDRLRLAALRRDAAAAQTSRTDKGEDAETSKRRERGA
jgi:hypothetical protein